MNLWLWVAAAYGAVALVVFLFFLVDALRPTVTNPKFDAKATIGIGAWIGVLWFPFVLLLLANRFRK